MLNENYVAHHVHSDYSLLDSTTDYHKYIEKAVSLGQKALAFTEHGNIYNWVLKKIACEKAGIKYIHGVEVYLTRSLDEKVRDNYHTILLAKNEAGVNEINTLVSISSQGDHTYYKPRITFDEFLKISDNVIKTSACLASPLSKMDEDDVYYSRLARHYDYYEVQAHKSPDQMFYNERLIELAKKYNKKLIAGTDTHSIDNYYSECRSIIQAAKGIEYTNEDEFDLSYKSYSELVQMFKDQGVLTEKEYLEAIENTNVMADSVKDFKLDISFKYPLLYGDSQTDKEVFEKRIEEMFNEKILNGIIPLEVKEKYLAKLEEEKEVFAELEMPGFMLFMSEMLTYCRENDVPIGFGRGSVAGSRVAYVTDITDVDPEVWDTVFSRFCNRNRKEIGDLLHSLPLLRGNVKNLVNHQMVGVGRVPANGGSLNRIAAR